MEGSKDLAGGVAMYRRFGMFVLLPDQPPVFIDPTFAQSVGRPDRIVYASGETAQGFRKYTEGVPRTVIVGFVYKRHLGERKDWYLSRGIRTRLFGSDCVVGTLMPLDSPRAPLPDAHSRRVMYDALMAMEQGLLQVSRSYHQVVDAALSIAPDPLAQDDPSPSRQSGRKDSSSER